MKEKKKSSLLKKIFFFIAITITIALFYFSTKMTHPQFPRHRVWSSTIIADLKALAKAEDIYFDENKKYTQDISVLKNFTTSHDITIDFAEFNEQCYIAKGAHKRLKRFYWIDCNGILYEYDETSGKLVAM